ncbi:MAG: aminopeptidase [Francisellaceae bacterium]|nr:aminopeptidase [Francisellaceae bacterium]
MPNSNQIIYLKDYKKPVWNIEWIHLDFDLFEEFTMVKSEMKLKANEKSESLVLDGCELELTEIKIDGKVLNSSLYQLADNQLVITAPPKEFLLNITVKINPQNNKSLNGLYKSKKLFCTQCEAEGFRNITYYLDRPDVLSLFTTTIRANKQQYPVLLSNGNCIAKGSQGERHWVKWEDPFKKPAYLFALVAGDLVSLEDNFLTCSKRIVNLKLYLERENWDKGCHALESLKKAMIWDEQTYGREYDLDTYMIVAVSDFNMGAMENKGLNIFNDKTVLARPETATDQDYQLIEAVVGHEYFHNWSGNRITCRDWFQLSLKEGLTVFREQHFCDDISQSTARRIEDVKFLKLQQFPEDSGPLAHPVQPNSYLEINNFYTVTIYEKGAEIIRMLRTVLGWPTFRKAMDRYFEQFDGVAATVNDFVNTMQTISGLNLEQFKLWYTQVGTPELEIKEHYDDKNQKYTLIIKQNRPLSLSNTNLSPFYIPIKIALLSEMGELLLNEQLLIFNQAIQTFDFESVKEKPILSILRDFSAPVKIKSFLNIHQLAILAMYDNDPYKKWEANFELLSQAIMDLSKLNDKQLPDSVKLIFKVLEHHFNNKDLRVLNKAEMFILPNLAYLLDNIGDVEFNIDNISKARNTLMQHVASHFESEWMDLYQNSIIKGPYQYNAENMGYRRLQNIALFNLCQLDIIKYAHLALTQYNNANNMTEKYGALEALLASDYSENETIANNFFETYKHNHLIINKWFVALANVQKLETLDKVKSLIHHPAFDIKNPNNVYSLIRVFSDNLIAFHQANGKAYEFMQDMILKIDKFNPQVASRLVKCFSDWKKFDVKRQNYMKTCLEGMMSEPNLSKNVHELVSKLL